MSRVSEPLIRRDLHWGRYGLNPDVRPYRGTDHIRAQKFMSLACTAVGLNATKQSSTLRWQLQTHALSLDTNEEVTHTPAKTYEAEIARRATRQNVRIVFRVLPDAGRSGPESITVTLPR